MTLGVYLNDAGLAVAGTDLPVVVSPSIIHADPAQPQTFGTLALNSARLTPRLVSTEHWSVLARLGTDAPSATRTIIRAELRNRLNVSPQKTPVQCAVPAVLSTEALGTVLALMRLDGMEVASFHDAAALNVASVGLEGVTLVLEMGLGHVSATRVETEKVETDKVETDRKVRRRASATWQGYGLLALQQRWLQLIAEAMVLQTRFDPLHDGLSEQRLYDQLERTYSAATFLGSASIELPTPQGALHIILTRDQFADAASKIYAQAQAVLHELRPAGARVNILIDERLTQLPGFIESLASLRGCRIFSHSSGLAARAAAAEVAAADGDGSVIMQRGYARRAPIESPKEIDLSNITSVGVSPTHALCDGKAIALPVGSLEIGRGPAMGGVRLPEGLAGVSRLHCALEREASSVTLVPYTSQPTWLNDERVKGRVRVLSGDRLRIGTPGVVIELIAVGGAIHGAPPQG